MVIQYIPANRQNYGEKRHVNSIQFIVVHYTGNDGDTAISNGNYFKNNIIKTSAHYFVDDNHIVRSVDDDYVAWAVGGSKYADTSKTGGGKMYGVCTNTNSISIELCDTLKNGTSGFTNMTTANAVKLIRELMVRYKVNINHVIRHFDVTGKICPKPFVDSYKWQDFKNTIEEVIDMETLNRLEEENRQLKQVIGNLIDRITRLEKPMVYNYIDRNMPEWARATIQKLVDKGILLGNENGELGLTEDVLKTLVYNDRAGLY